MTRIVLLVPPWYRLLGGSFAEMPLGLCSLAGYLQTLGHEVQVLNADFEPNGRGGEIEQESMLARYDDYRRVMQDPEAPIWQRTLNEVEDLKPELLGMTAQVGSFGSARIIASLFRARHAEVPVVVGGPMASISPEDCLAVEAFDYVVQGEGELPFAELAAALETGADPGDIANLAFRRRERNVINPRRPEIDDLDTLPFPNREVLVHRDRYPTDALGLLFTARGCPFHCTYCAASAVWSRKVRFRSPENVLAEMASVYQRFGVRRFTFKDDTFTLKKDRIHRLCELIRGELAGVTWSCLTRADCVDEPLVRAMARAGCRHVELGLESGCPEILKVIKKGETVEQIAQAARWFRSAGIAIAVNIILGFPGETPAQMRRSFAVARDMRPARILVSLLAPYPGTEIHQTLRGQGALSSSDALEDFFHASGSSSRLHHDPDFAHAVHDILTDARRYNRSRVRRLGDLARLAIHHPGVACSRLRSRLRPTLRVSMRRDA